MHGIATYMQNRRNIGAHRIAQAVAAGMTSDCGGGYHALVLSDDRLVTVDLGSTAFVARMVEPAKPSTITAAQIVGGSGK